MSALQRSLPIQASGWREGVEKAQKLEIGFHGNPPRMCARRISAVVRRAGNARRRDVLVLRYGRGRVASVQNEALKMTSRMTAGIARYLRSEVSKEKATAIHQRPAAK